MVESEKDTARRQIQCAISAMISNEGTSAAGIGGRDEGSFPKQADSELRLG